MFFVIISISQFNKKLFSCGQFLLKSVLMLWQIIQNNYQKISLDSFDSRLYLALKINMICLIVFTSQSLVLASGSEKALLSGAFIQINSQDLHKSTDYWSKLIEDMFRINFDTIIIQYSSFGKNCLYPALTRLNCSVYKSSPVENDAIEAILQKADELEMTVFLGLALEPSFAPTWNKEANSFEFNYDLNTIIERAKNTLTELYELYGFGADSRIIHKSLLGWYLPIELNDADIIRTAHKTYLLDLIKYYNELTAFAHEKTSLKIMISPFFAADDSFTTIEPRSPKIYAEWWAQFLVENEAKGSQIDIVAFQDSIGVGHMDIIELAEYLLLLEPIFQNSPSELWLNNEAFRVGNETAYISVGFEDFREQINGSFGFTHKAITFEFSKYWLEPSRELYNSYQKYCCSQ